MKTGLFSPTTRQKVATLCNSGDSVHTRPHLARPCMRTRPSDTQQRRSHICCLPWRELPVAANTAPFNARLRRKRSERQRRLSKTRPSLIQLANFPVSALQLPHTKSSTYSAWAKQKAVRERLPHFAKTLKCPCNKRKEISVRSEPLQLPGTVLERKSVDKAPGLGTRTSTRVPGRYRVNTSTRPPVPGAWRAGGFTRVYPWWVLGRVLRGYRTDGTTGADGQL